MDRINQLIRISGVLLLLICGLHSSHLNAANYASQLHTDSFGRLPDVSMAKLSPDGSKMISLARINIDGVRGVTLDLLDLKQNKQKSLLWSDNTKFVILWMAWAGNDAVLISTFYPSRFYGTQTTGTRLMRVDVNSAKITSAIPSGIFERAKFNSVIQDNVVDHLTDSPDEILVSLRLQNQVGSEVYKINHRKRSSRRVQRFRARTMDWMTDRQHRVRIASYFSDTTVRFSHRPDKKAPWQTLFEYEVFADDFRRPLGFDADPDILYFEALHEGRTAIFKAKLSVQPLQPELVFAHSDYDVEGQLVYSRKGDRVVGLQHSVDEGYVFWDAEFNALQAAVDRALPNKQNTILGFSDDERRFLIRSSNDTDAGTYLYWNRDSGVMAMVANRYKDLKPDLMSPKQRVNYTARDGLDIEAYLTRPKGAGENAGPTIIFPHGGPIYSDGRGFDYWTQYFASRGYNVLQMNFRGSAGYGHDFMLSGLQDWGGKMQTDVEDGTRWLIEQGIADADKICVVGASYGGYAALMEAANNPDLYQCVVSFAGVTDLQLLLSRSRRFTNYDVVKQQIGKRGKQLEQRSPINRADEIDVPVLLAQGSKDLRVPLAHGRTMHKRLKKYNKRVEYLEFEDGNHYLSNEEHRVALFRAMDKFLKSHLN